MDTNRKMKLLGTPFIVVALALCATPSVADPIVLTGGRLFLPSPAAGGGFDPPNSFTLLGDRTFIFGETFNFGIGGFSAGETVSLSGSVFQTAFLNLPRTLLVGGVSFPNVFLIGGVSMSADPFVAPLGTDGAIVAFSTPFTLTGRFTGFDNFSGSGVPLFDASVTGSGTATVFDVRTIGSGSASLFLVRAGTQFDLASPSPIPEPTTVLFAATGLATAAARYLRRRNRPAR